MIEITNRKKQPVQIVVRSTKAPRAFTVLNIPGVGAHKNVAYIEDERHTKYVDEAESRGEISTKHVANKPTKGE
jgi:hypothetical protein